MGIKFLGTSKKSLTPEVAEDFATMEAFKGERPLSERRVKQLENELRAGRFYSPRWAVAYLNGRRVRVNGQHSSLMLAQANGHFPTKLDVLIDEYAIDSEADLPELFDRFDQPFSTRTLRDLVTAHVAVEDGLAEVSKRDIQQLVGGIAFAADPHKNKTDLRSRAALVHYHQDFILWAHPFFMPNKMSRVPAIACAFKSWSLWPQESTEFWTLVRDASHPDPRNASRSLSDLLIQQQGRGTLHGSSRLKPIELHVKCIRAWNAWRTNQTTLMKVLRRDTYELPELV